jgi:hypothetical protein
MRRRERRQGAKAIGEADLEGVEPRKDRHWESETQKGSSLLLTVGSRALGEMGKPQVDSFMTIYKDPSQRGRKVKKERTQR